MDFDRLLSRVKGILLQPNREWPVIAGEAESVASLYKRYILILAAVPVVFQFIKSSLIGYHVFGVFARAPIGGGLARLVLGYLLSLVLVYVIASIIDALAPTFEGRKDRIQALKVTAYAWTASWVAGIAVVIPWLGWLIMLAGGLYAIYLLYLGLPHTMQCPREKSLGYTALSVVIAFVLSWILGVLLAALTGAGAMMHHLHQRADRDARTEAAATASANDRSSGMTDDTTRAEHIQSLAPDRMRTMLPESLDDLKRSNARASRQDVMNMQISQAEATYSGDDDQRVDLTLTDTGGARSLLALSGMITRDMETVTDDGFEKVRHDGDRIVHERWNDKTHRGEYAVLIAGRYAVRARGHVKNFDVLKDAVDAVDLDALEKLRDSGADAH
ncbi:Yip1 family protein [Oleiagrimonas soli]|uniref:Yip1 domain-containing protein n=1 Tax=Oleiagrimonas soli TaxID=1543381 RepID=A0A099CSB4_9GAMM|nr:Yip1 family protein [Oleiagrimonas soli]KGI76669.1 hypothetical protein LF63_0113930 [Oleiagrimonas soli]MBB6185119.1 hypothetical protein [Oleiagrimonas soli]